MNENKKSNDLAREALNELVNMPGEQLLKEVENAPEHELSQALVDAQVIPNLLSETEFDIEKITTNWGILSKYIFVPRSDFELDKLIAILDKIIDRVGNNEKHPLASLADVIGTLIEDYENSILDRDLKWENNTETRFGMS